MNTRREFLIGIPAVAAASVPASRPRLTLAAPIDRWDEAIPLGNGLLGGLLWGGGRTLRLSLDRGDLWDLRTPDTLLRPDWTWATLKKLVAEKNQREIVRMFDDAYELPYPTKVPAGRIEITLARDVRSFTLDLERAVGAADDAQVFFSAAEPVAMMRVPGGLAAWRILPPASVSKLGYAPAREGSDGTLKWYLQKAALGLEYAVVAGTRGSELAIAIASSKDGPDPVALGMARVRRALDSGFARMLQPHTEWWRRFRAQSRVRLPDPALQLHYDEVRYFYGAASRRGAPPIPLQGVWTADEGTLPPWHGDYHHDLNTQLTYWPYLAAGHFDEGACFLDHMWNLLPEYRRFAKEFFGAPGAAIPGAAALDGKPLGGWSQYSLTPTNGAWVAQAFYLHWRYTMDRDFLTGRAYPFCKAIAECLEALLEPDARGRLTIPLSSSPEIHDNSLKAWLTPNSNYDLALMRWLFGALAELAPESGQPADAARWRAVLGRLDELAVEGEDGALRVSRDESLMESHRHFSHLMAIHPLGTLHIEGSPRDRRVIDASLRQLDSLGTAAWMGYSFAWRAAMAARVGDAAGALRNLRAYLDAFISRNGFHLNGDYKGKGYAAARYRPFTLEGNFGAMQAVNEMLLQSWGGMVRIFPAVPAEWADVSFENLRAEGAFAVSAVRKAGRTVSLAITAKQAGSLRLRDPFPGRRAVWSRQGVTRKGDLYECNLPEGGVLQGHA